LQSIVVDISSGEEPACQKDSAPEAPEDFLAPVSALVALQDPDPKALEGPMMPVDAPVTLQGPQEPVVATSVVSSSLEGPAVTLSTASLPPKGACLQEPTAASSAVTPPSERVSPEEPIITPPAVTAPPPERTHPQERIITSSTVVTPPREQVCFTTKLFLFFLVLPYSHVFFQGLNLSELLAFDPTSVGSAILEVDDPQPDLTSVAS
jgi:hypothetical protein